MTEHTRLLGEVAPALKDLCAQVQRVWEGEIAKPVREIAPISLWVQELAMQCTRQFHDLSVSQYAAMKGGAENLAHLAGACSQISLAATLCNLAIQDRTEILLYEDADPTPAASRNRLQQAGDEMQRAATTYRSVAQQLSRRLASAAARNEDQQLIAHALADGPKKAPTTTPLAPAATTSPAPAGKPSTHTTR
ncbi:hypothetical protein [Streptomyces shenzhenensis]|uniref:Uncharacterized protein n=1 Tax=Streptomyces shenzhenensis TaxID=943815 RepID=A0A3M0I383_9ACTN|nr:hypothetical protein [Streptomyces shenzhenensis]RMB80549.1 hypothetical protein CTZ28_39625 [Streptomyces shenzhenensis]